MIHMEMQDELLRTYFAKIPDFLLPFLDSKEMQRLKGVGMNCGVEYTSLPFFNSLPESSRFSHSLGVALLCFRFGGTKIETLAGLFHDIATPCFAHSIDFLKGDHTQQEKTEEGTSAIIASSKEINQGLSQMGIGLEQVSDYSLYPICDNSSPQLSCDRLEYTLRNIYLYNVANLDKIAAFCADLALFPNENGEDELQFSSLDIALDFGLCALPTFEVYISKEDRYAMEILASTLGKLLLEGIIKESDLMDEEDILIQKIIANEKGKGLWEHYRSLTRVEVADFSDKNAIVVPSKTRYIDPLVHGKGRLSEISELYRAKISSLKSTDFSLYLRGVYE